MEKATQRADTVVRVLAASRLMARDARRVKKSPYLCSSVQRSGLTFALTEDHEGYER